MAQIRWKTFVIIILPSVVLSIAAWHNFSVSQDDVMYLANDDEQRHIADIRSNDEHQSLDDVRRKQSDAASEKKQNVCNRTARLKHLRQTCDEMKLTGDPIPWGNLTGPQWIVDDMHRVFYCMIPKAATHAIRHLLATPVLGTLNASVLYPMENYLSATGFRLLHRLDEAERRTVLASYFKMLVVRHPLDRLRSAHANKMKWPGHMNWQVLHSHLQIVADHLHERGKLADGAAFDPYNMTIDFGDFLDLIARHRYRFINEHWMPSYDICYPCSIRYDAVMRVETLRDDVRALYPYLTSKGRQKPRLRLRNVDLFLKKGSKLDIVGEIFRQISAQTMTQILNMYERDFRLFGYNWDPDGGATCRITTKGSGEVCC